MCIKKNDSEDIDITNKETILELFERYEEDLYQYTDENREYASKITNIETGFYESLTDEQKQQFEELTELKGLNSGVTDRNIFIFAFSLAVRLILESKQD